MTDVSQRPSRSKRRGTSDEERKILAAGGTPADRRGGRWGAVGMPAERSHDFGAAVRRLGQLLGTEKPALVLVGLLTVCSVTLVALGPRLLGHATDIIVRGVVTGAGIDKGDLHRTLAFVAGLYLLSWLLSYSQA